MSSLTPVDLNSSISDENDLSIYLKCNCSQNEYKLYIMKKFLKEKN